MIQNLPVRALMLGLSFFTSSCAEGPETPASEDAASISPPGLAPAGPTTTDSPSAVPTQVPPASAGPSFSEPSATAPNPPPSASTPASAPGGGTGGTPSTDGGTGGATSLGGSAGTGGTSSLGGSGGFGGLSNGGSGGGSLAGGGGTGGAAVENPEDFDEGFREVAALIQTRCADLCHGGREGQEHLVNFSTTSLASFYETLTSPLQTSLCYGEPPVTPGSAEGSLLLHVVAGPLEDPCVLPQMPAGCGEDPLCLSAEEVSILESWISAGAPRDR
jgi:hypothetical protein